MKKLTLAFDTSNYTTSCAVFDGETGMNSGRLLDVAPGQLGLRQSDALYAHIRRLPSVTAALDLREAEVAAVGASTKPREAEDSYMPCFLAGASHGAVLAKVLGVPFFEFSHQQGHIAAAAWSAGRADLLETPHLAWHLSGGTTELLYVKPAGTAVTCEVIGGTTDISAGQLIDRAGQLLGLRFPSGKALDKLAQTAAGGDFYAPKTTGLEFSLSGAEHKMKQLKESGADAADVAYFTIMSVIAAVRRATENAASKYGDLPVLFSGGVASNALLRQTLSGGIYAEPQYSTDNALGVAILTYRAVGAHE
ncbi:N6-L-threonylcarbamoyladenine synthase [Sporobacter termitidis DSM 10068]|uniref:N(6)-L-threonylcarbamoyladenine synthase n=1 Tax=Sporobacter termitidis DSM 10068 TaxID=1123282 RepID=A0A1M5Y8C2_9FIRM|nr:DNA-binding protein [Sporobacter termitidis]SHI08206.1 N6-L-threonylcarbamoyladenine synthase [Sporobacter termitidis DSM 10068]